MAVPQFYHVLLVFVESRSAVRDDRNAIPMVVHFSGFAFSNKSQDDGIELTLVGRGLDDEIWSPLLENQGS